MGAIETIKAIITRIKAAKDKLRAWLTDAGVTVPDGAKLDGMVALLDNVQVAKPDDWKITDASYLFYKGARWGIKDFLLQHLASIANATHMFDNVPSSVGDFNLLEFPSFEKVENASYMFANNKLIKSLTGLKFGSVTDASYMFQYSSIEEIDTTDIFSKDASVLTNFMFDNATKLKTAKIVGKLRSMYAMFAQCGSLESVDLSCATTDDNNKLGSIMQAFTSCQKVKSVDLTTLDLSNVSSAYYAFSGCNALEEIIGFAAPGDSSMSKPFPIGTSSSHCALRRLVFADVPAGKYAVKASFSIAYDSFGQDGMVEMFNSLPDVSKSGLAASKRQITITGNPCVTDGTLTDADRAIATSKGWTLVE